MYQCERGEAWNWTILLQAVAWGWLSPLCNGAHFTNGLLIKGWHVYTKVLPYTKPYLPWCLPSPPAGAAPSSWEWCCCQWGNWRRQPSPDQCRIHSYFPAVLPRRYPQSHCHGQGQPDQHLWPPGTQLDGKGMKWRAETLWEHEDTATINVAVKGAIQCCNQSQDTSALTWKQEDVWWLVSGMQLKQLVDTLCLQSPLQWTTRTTIINLNFQPSMLESLHQTPVLWGWTVPCQCPVLIQRLWCFTAT